jgi:hypothetical protein
VVQRQDYSRFKMSLFIVAILSSVLAMASSSWSGKLAFDKQQSLWPNSDGIKTNIRIDARLNKVKIILETEFGGIEYVLHPRGRVR